ncbi:MAG: flagellar biosynthesis anti-sigma factor FlgM [Candidatus Competibacteraceae bacterium]|nr:flagellar biosynthesis anti-sigma factor FlgM [Candidatus Competibacteraceae bacterium]
MAIDSINNASPHTIRSGSPQSERPQATDGTPPASTGASQDPVKFTEQSQKLRDLEQSLGQEPSFDAGRVEALRKVIDSGDYRVNAQRVAEKLLDLEGELFK